MTKSDGSWRGGGLRDGKRKQKKYADVAKLADAQVSGSCGRPYGFESLHPHQSALEICKNCIFLRFFSFFSGGFPPFFRFNHSFLGASVGQYFISPFSFAPSRKRYSSDKSV